MTQAITMNSRQQGIFNACTLILDEHAENGLTIDNMRVRITVSKVAKLFRETTALQRMTVCCNLLHKYGARTD